MQFALLNKKRILITTSLIILIFLGGFLLLLFNEPAPQLFPLNNPKAQYRIEKSENNVYTIAYKDNSQDIKGVMIGNSKINLDQFIGKNVQIKGEFKNRKDTQCIAGKCQYIYGPYVALDIFDIQERQDEK